MSNTPAGAGPAVKKGLDATHFYADVAFDRIKMAVGVDPSLSMGSQ